MGYLNDLGQKALATAKSKGFMVKPDEDLARQLLMMVSEISEACEADRGDKFTAPEINDLLSNPPSELSDAEFMKFYEEHVKGKFEEEMADLLIRNIQYSAYRKLDLDAHVAAKMRYNSLRPHKHGGKKY
jgi:hypothetical protein